MNKPCFQFHSDGNFWINKDIFRNSNNNWAGNGFVGDMIPGNYATKPPLI